MSEPSGSETTRLWRPVGQFELDLIRDADWRAFPPRLEGQPIFYPVLNEGYAIQIARDWNPKDAASGFVGYVTMFDVESMYLERFERRVVGDESHEELWVPAEELEEFNSKIRGKIVVTHEFRGGR